MTMPTLAVTVGNCVECGHPRGEHRYFHDPDFPDDRTEFCSDCDPEHNDATGDAALHDFTLERD